MPSIAISNYCATTYSRDGYLLYDIIKMKIMNKIILFHFPFLILALLFVVNIPLCAQQLDEPKSTEDLSFLNGKWDVVRVYSPDSDNERVLNGTLICEESLDGQFIKCTYEMERPGKIRGLDVVYFNYNSIYKLYESVWLSSTWPIKGILQGNLQKEAERYILSTSGQFQIENNVTEYVRDEMKTIKSKGENLNSFVRETHIRTSNFEEGVWHHHMTETAQRIK